MTLADSKNTPDRRLPQPSPPSPGSLSLVLHFYALLVGVRFAASLLLREPVIFPDELGYKAMALGFFQSGNFAAFSQGAIGAVTAIPNVLYPLLLSGLVPLGDGFLTAAKLLNALLINAAIFPFYGLLRDFLSGREAARAAALSLLLPSFAYSAFLMAENVYFPLVAAGLFLLYRQFTRGSLLGAVPASVVLVLLFLAKYQSVAFFAAIPVAAAALLALRRWRLADPGRARTVLGGLGIMAVVFLAGGVLIELAVPGSFLRMASGVLHMTQKFGASLISFAAGARYVPAAFVRMAVSHLSTVLILFAVPLLVTLWAWTGSVKSADRKRAVLAALTLSLCLTSLLMTILVSAGFRPTLGLDRLHGRFYVAAFPVLVVCFAAFVRRIDWTGAKRLTLAATGAAAALAGLWALPGYIRGPVKHTLLIDYPELGWAALVRPGVLAGALGLLVLAAAAILVAGKARPWAAFLLPVVLVANVVHYQAFLRFFQPSRLALRPARAFVAGCIPDPLAKVAVFSRKPDERVLLAFWHPYSYTRSAALSKDGTLKKAMIPPETEYAILFGERKLDFEPVREYRQNGCSVLVLTERIDVLRDFIGVYQDPRGRAWTEPKFSYDPGEAFRTLTLVLYERRPFFPSELTVETPQGTTRIRLDEGAGTIELPFAASYRFRVDKPFDPRLAGLTDRGGGQVGLGLRGAFIRY